MGALISPPQFITPQPPIPFTAANIGQALIVQSATKLGFGAVSGGGGLLAARYAVTVATGTIDNLDPGSGWPNTDEGFRLILNPSTGAVTLTGLKAGNDGELGLIWNNAAIGGNTIQLNNLDSGSSAANQFTLAGSALMLPPQSGTLATYDATLALWLLK